MRRHWTKLSRVFRYQFCQQTTNNGIGIENTCPAQSDKIVPVPDLSIGSSHSPGAFGCLRRNRSGRGDSCAAKGTGFRVPLGRFWAPACRRLGLMSRIWVRSGAWVGYLRFRSVWCGFWCLRKSVADACHPVTAISVVPKLGTTQAVWMPGL